MNQPTSMTSRNRQVQTTKYLMLSPDGSAQKVSKVLLLLVFCPFCFVVWSLPFLICFFFVLLCCYFVVSPTIFLFPWVPFLSFLLLSVSLICSSSLFLALPLCSGARPSPLVFIAAPQKVTPSHR